MVGSALAIAGAVLVVQVLVPPVVGLANNGDFNTVLAALHLVPVDEKDPDRFFTHVVVTYKAHPEPMWKSGLVTSEIVLLTPAYWVNRLIVSKDGTFDIRWAGVTHSVLFLGALLLLMPVLAPLGCWRQGTILAALLLVFLDVEYVSWFNTLYADPTSLLTLFLMVVLFLRIVLGRGSETVDPALFLVCATFFVTSKAQHTPLALPLVAFMFWKRRLLGIHGRRWVMWSLAGILVVATVMVLVVTPQRYGHTPLYTVIFSKIVPGAASPEAALAELGLDRSFVRYSGTHAYSPQGAFVDPKQRQVFMASTSHLKLARYYLRHPEVPFELWKTGLGLAGLRRPVAFGNFPKNAGFAPRSTSTSFALASDLKRKLMGNRPFAGLAFLLASGGLLLGFCWRMRGDSPGLLEGACLLVLAAVMEMLIACLLDTLETTRHLFIYNAMVDVLFVGALAAVLAAWVVRRRRPRGGTLPSRAAGHNAVQLEEAPVDGVEQQADTHR